MVKKCPGESDAGTTGVISRNSNVCVFCQIPSQLLSYNSDKKIVPRITGWVGGKEHFIIQGELLRDLMFY